MQRVGTQEFQLGGLLAAAARRICPITNVDIGQGDVMSCNIQNSALMLDSV